MSKKQINTLHGKAFTATVDGKKVTATVTADFKNVIVNAAKDIGKVEPAMMNLYRAYRELVEANGVKGAPRMGILAFFRMFDSSIPDAYGEPASEERAKLDSHVMYNRFRRMVQTGRRLVEGTASKTTQKQRDAKRTAKVKAYADLAKKFKLTASCVREILALASLKTTFQNDVLKKAAYSAAVIESSASAA